MNIVYVVTRAHPIGGVQIHVRDLAISLQAQGHTCTVVTGGTGLFVDMLRAERIPTIILRHLVVPIHPLHDALALGEIRAALKRLVPTWWRRTRPRQASSRGWWAGRWVFRSS